MEGLSKKQCSLCLKTDPQISFILSSLEQKLFQLISKCQIEEKNEFQNTKNLHGFYRLIRVIFSKKFKHSKTNMNCRHEQVKKCFIKKLKCSNHQFNLACDKLANIVGKFNFHIDTLIQQMKGFQRYLKCEKGEEVNNSHEIKQYNQEIFQKTRIKQVDQRKDKISSNQIKQEQYHEQYECNLKQSLQVIEPCYQLDFNAVQNPFILPVNYLWIYGQK